MFTEFSLTYIPHSEPIHILFTSSAHSANKRASKPKLTHVREYARRRDKATHSMKTNKSEWQLLQMRSFLLPKWQTSHCTQMFVHKMFEFYCQNGNYPKELSLQNGSGNTSPWPFRVISAGLPTPWASAASCAETPLDSALVAMCR